MSDEIKLRKDTERARLAANLLDDGLLKESFASLEASYIKAWRETPIGDVAGREKLFLAVNVIGKVQDHLQGVIRDGQLAKRELDEIAKLAEPRKRFGIV